MSAFHPHAMHLAPFAGQGGLTGASAELPSVRQLPGYQTTPGTAGSMQGMKGRKRIALISTGGTIEKTYDELEGVLHNNFSVLDVMLASMLLEGVEIVRVPLMNKDSVEMTEADHLLIGRTALNLADAHDGVVIVHGTDTLAATGETIHREAKDPRVPIVLTGAMRPFELRSSDAPQNLTEALLAVQLLEAGVYVAMHNRVLRFPGVVKDKTRGRFIYATP
jgi:L-asparaginase